MKTVSPSSAKQVSSRCQVLQEVLVGEGGEEIGEPFGLRVIGMSPLCELLNDPHVDEI